MRSSYPEPSSLPYQGYDRGDGCGLNMRAARAGMNKRCLSLAERFPSSLWDENDVGINANLSRVANQCRAELAERGQFVFIPVRTSKGMILENMLGLFGSSPRSLGAPGALGCHTAAIEQRPIEAAGSVAADDKAAPQAVIVPLLATAATAGAIHHPGGRHRVYTALSLFGLTGFLYASKQLWPLVHQTSEKTSQLNQGGTETAFTLPPAEHNPPEITLATEDNLMLFFYAHDNDDDYYAHPLSEDDEIALRLQPNAPAAILAPPAKSTTTTQPPADDVIAERIDLTCVEKRQNVSIGDMLRQIGKTLSYPISELAKESQVVIFYEKFKKCPTEKDIKALESITLGIDAFVSFFMGMLPDGVPVVILQNIGGPLFQLFADAIENKDLDIENISAINEQVLFLARATWDFSPRERNGKINTKKIVLPQRTVFKQSKLSTEINNDAYGLHLGENRYIATNGRSHRPVTYSHEEGRWLYLEPDAYLYEIKFHEDMVDAYKVTNDYIQSMRKHKEGRQGIFFDSKNKMLYVMRKDGKYSKFVFLQKGNMRFNVEVDYYSIKGVHYCYAKKKGRGNKIVRKNNKEIYFEARSAKINDNLSLFLTENMTPHTLSDTFHVTNIMKDGFSYDDKHQRYLKYNNGYYRVERDAYNGDYFSFHKQGKDDKCYIKKNKSGFFDIDPGFSSDRLVQRFVTTDEGYILEKDMLAEIENNCIRMDTQANLAVGTWMFTRDNGDTLFSLNGASYRVVQHARHTLQLKSKYDHVDDIFLFRINDCYFENNEKRVEDKYDDISSLTCKIKRSPTAGACKVTLLSKIASNLLLKHAKKGAVVLGHLEERLRVSELFPGLFIDKETSKFYFKHNGRYFRAEFSARSSRDIIIHPMLHVYYKGFLGSKQTIASLVYDVVDKKTLIQTQQEFVTDNTHMTVKEAQDFIDEYKYIRIADFTNLRDVVAEINKKENLKFVLPIEIVNVNVNMWAEAKWAFSYHDYNFRIFSMDQISDTEPLYIRGGRLLVKNAIQYAREQMDIAISELDKLTPNAQKYLGYIIGDERSSFVRAFAERLSKNLKEIREKVTEENIKLVCQEWEPVEGEIVEHDPVRDEDMLLNAPLQETYFHRPAIPEAERRSGAVAFVPLDVDKNIHVCLDKLHFHDPIHPDESLRTDPCLDVTETLIHEAAHSMGLSHDIFYISTEEGKLIPVLDAIDEYGRTIGLGRLDDKAELIFIQQDYMRMHPEYSTFSGQIRNNDLILSYMYSNDIGFKLNVLFSTPDFFAIFVRDLYLNAAVVQARR